MPVARPVGLSGRGRNGRRDGAHERSRLRELQPGVGSPRWPSRWPFCCCYGSSGTNEAWFYRLNGWSEVTGPQLWAGITIFGDALVLLALALPILWYRPQWAWALLVAAIVTTVVTHTMKPWLDLPRPAAVLGADAITIIGPELRAKAMPSGHAAAALTLAGALVPTMKGMEPPRGRSAGAHDPGRPVESRRSGALADGRDGRRPDRLAVRE